MKAIGFKQLSIFHLAMLLCERGETRVLEHITKLVLTPVAFACPTLMTIPTTKVAKALVHTAVLSQKPFQLLDNAEIHHVAETPLGGAS